MLEQLPYLATTIVKWNIRRSTEGEFTRQERTTLVQIRTGHCVLLKAYRKRIGL